MNPTSQRSLQQAYVLFQQKRLRESEALCRKVIDDEPRAVDAVNLLALICKQSGDLTQAENLMRRCLEIEAGRADIRGNLGNLLAQVGRPREAVDCYRAALQDDRRFRPARLGLARTLLALGQASAGEAEADRLIRHDARDAEAWNIRGTALRMQGKFAGAERAFNRALSIHPDYAVARHNLGALLASLSRSEEALVELDRAAAGGIQGPEIAHNRASALMALGEFDAAEKVLVDVLRQAPAAVAVNALLARLRYMRGNSDFAGDFRRALARYPELVELRVGYSQIQRGAGNIEESLRAMEEGLDRASDDPRLLAEMSAVLHEAGRFEEALKCAEQAVAAGPGDPELNDLIVQAQLSLGRAEAALRLIEKARRREPLNQLYIALEATALRLLGDPRFESLYDYERLVQCYRLPVPKGWSSIEDFHADLVPVLVERHKFRAPPLDQSLRAGTQTARGLVGDPNPVIQAFLKAIQAPIGQYRQTMGTDPGHPLSARNSGDCSVIGCWSVRLHREGYHVNHVHSEGWISSAYYVEVPPEVDDSKAQSGWIKFGEPRFPVPAATAGKFVKPEAGTLVLFPSYMWHGTTPIHGEDARMTIAFDVVPESASK